MSATAPPPPDPRLQLLLDKDELRELSFLYAHRIVAHDYRGLANLFTEDGVLDYSDVVRLARPAQATAGQQAQGSTLVFEGRQAICDFVPAICRLEVKAFFGSHVLRVTGDTAIGIVLFENRLVQRGESVIGAGRMFDEYRRAGGRWLIAYRRQELFYFTGLHEGWAQGKDRDAPPPITDQRGWETSLIADWGTK